MRIRRSASRLLGSAYSAAPAPAPDAAPPFKLPLPLPLPPPPPPQPHLEPCAPPKSLGGGGSATPATSSGEPCQLNRSPWDLIAELTLSDPQMEDDLVDKYFVHVSCRSSWLFPAIKPAASVKELDAAAGDSARPPWCEVAKKVPKKVTMSKEKGKESEIKKKTKVKKEEDKDGKAQTWDCKKNDGRGWHCPRKAGRPDSLCDYHFYKKHSHLDPEFALEAAAAQAPATLVAAPASKPWTSSKHRKKKKSGHDFGAREGFYYYAGFGPFRSRRDCRSTMHDSVPPPKQEEEDESVPEEAAAPRNQAKGGDTNRATSAHRGDVSSCDDVAGIAGGDEESSDDDYRLGGTRGRNVNGGSEHRGVGNGDNKRKNPWKRWRKPVKARSLKSLM